MTFPFAGEDNPNLPLSGLKVLDLSRLLPGPYASLLLADLGADVLKVEDTGVGDYLRWGGIFPGGENPAFMALNRNKRSIKINLKKPEGVEIFKKLAKEADVVLESFRPGVMDRLGIGYKDLSPANPRLIYCAISGYGQDGPYRDRAGHDINYIGYAGALGQTGAKGGPPAIPGVQIADLAGGSMYGVIGILSALEGRHKTGRGRFVDISMTGGVVGWLVAQAPLYFSLGQKGGPGANDLNGGLPEYNVYETKDGKYLSVGALEPKFFNRLCRLLGFEQLDEVHSSGEKAVRIKTALTTRFKEKTRAEWLELLEEEEVCVGPVYDLDEVFEDPQVKARGLVVETEHPKAGKIRQVGLPFKMDGLEEKDYLRRPSPGFGEHTSQVLETLGYSTQGIQRLENEGII